MPYTYINFIYECPWGLFYRMQMEELRLSPASLFFAHFFVLMVPYVENRNQIKITDRLISTSMLKLQQIKCFFFFFFFFVKYQLIYIDFILRLTSSDPYVISFLWQRHNVNPKFDNNYKILFAYRYGHNTYSGLAQNQ